MAHRDRVERAGNLAVTAEDAARKVDLINGGVTLAGRDAVLGRVLGGHDADAVGRAGGRAERAADALLEAAVLKTVELMATAEAWVDGDLLFRVLNRVNAHPKLAKGRFEAAQRLAKGAVKAAGAARLLRSADYFNHVFFWIPGHFQTPIRRQQ